MSPGDVLILKFSSLQTCFEGTFSWQQANVLLILMASLVVSSFGDVHKWCMNAVNGFLSLVVRLWSLVSA